MTSKVHIATLSIFMAFFSACQEQDTPVPETTGPVPGEIQVLNACGANGAASRMRDYLMSKGFDVVEVGNGDEQNFDETVIAVRRPWWPGVRMLGKALHTDNIIPLENPLRMVDATVFVGRDFEDRIHE